jgi:hypothetical protein
VIPNIGECRDCSRTVRILLALCLFAYLVAVRTRHISDSFLLLGDQIRDWGIVLGPWRDLPLTGTPSTVGGTSFGPVFYWTLWGIRHAIGPWTGYLPHAGGVGLSVIQSAADALFLVALWRKTASAALAVAVTLLVATAPFDMALTATIWNPPLAVALVKMAIAMALLTSEWSGARSLLGVASTTAFAWLAVQAHSSAVFVALPVIVSYPLNELIARRRMAALVKMALAVAIVAVLQVPFLIDILSRPGTQAGPSVVIRNVAYALEHPEALRPIASLAALRNAASYILLGRWATSWFALVLIAAACVAGHRARRDLSLLSVTLLPLLCAVAGLAVWQGAFDHYWFLTMMPPVGLMIGLSLTAWRPIARPAAVSFLALVLVIQPSRLEEAMTIARLPEYAPLSRGSRDVFRRAPEVRAIETGFTLPATSDSEFLYRVLGGRVTASSPITARIERDGSVIILGASGR